MDKFTICNRALVATGNNRIETLGEGSDEGLHVEEAFDRAIQYLMAEHQWPFKTTDADLVRTGDSTLDPYEHSFALPQDCWHLRSVKTRQGGYDIQYIIHDNEVQSYLDSGIFAVYVKTPVLDDTWHASAVEVLTLLVESYLLRSLNEDFVEANSRRQEADTMLSRSRSRVDQQSSPRPGYKSMIGATRRRRRVT